MPKYSAKAQNDKPWHEVVMSPSERKNVAGNLKKGSKK